MAEPLVLPLEDDIRRARKAICRELPGHESTLDESEARINNLLPGLNGSSTSSRYYGFVTGGATPIARYADNIVTQADQNVQVHLPEETIATDVEDAALNMLCQLVDLDPKVWKHRTFTTGATASNVVGLALAREYVIVQASIRYTILKNSFEHVGDEALRPPYKLKASPGMWYGRNGSADPPSVAQLGLFKAMQLAMVHDVQILTTVPHSSIKKAASVIGFGHDSVKDVGCRLPNHKHIFDFERLENCLKQTSIASIIVVSCSEVNTGIFATRDYKDFDRLRTLADKYGAWIHVDAAIGLLARTLNKNQHSELNRSIEGVEGIELADSIAGDAHKLLNVVSAVFTLYSKSAIRWYMLTLVAVRLWHFHV